MDTEDGEHQYYSKDHVQSYHDRIPVLLVLEASGGMKQKVRGKSGYRRAIIDHLNDGLRIFKREIEEDFLSTHAVDVSVVTFGGDVKIEQEFDTIKNWKLPDLDATGTSPMCEAIGRGLQHLERHKTVLAKENLPQKRALVWLLTNGKPDNRSGTEWDKAQSVIEDGVEASPFLFYAVGCGRTADMDCLNELVSTAPNCSVETLQFDYNQFQEMFCLIAESVIEHTNRPYDNPPTSATELLPREINPK